MDYLSVPVDACAVFVPRPEVKVATDLNYGQWTRRGNAIDPSFGEGGGKGRGPGWSPKLEFKSVPEYRLERRPRKSAAFGCIKIAIFYLKRGRSDRRGRLGEGSEDRRNEGLLRRRAWKAIDGLPLSSPSFSLPLASRYSILTAAAFPVFGPGSTAFRAQSRVPSESGDRTSRSSFGRCSNKLEIPSGRTRPSAEILRGASVPPI